MSQTSTATHYPAATTSEQVETHTLSVLVDNEPGVLARVIGLFSGRAHNEMLLGDSAVSVEEAITEEGKVMV